MRYLQKPSVVHTSLCSRDASQNRAGRRAASRAPLELTLAYDQKNTRRLQAPRGSGLVLTWCLQGTKLVWPDLDITLGPVRSIKTRVQFMQVR